MTNKCIGTHRILLYIKRHTAVYFDSFRIEYIPQEVLNRIKDKSISRNIFRIQNDYSFKCRFYCITFIVSMIPNKTLLDYGNIFYVLWNIIYRKHGKVLCQLQERYRDQKFKCQKS